MHNILVPVNGSNHALRAQHIAGALALKYGGRLALMHEVAQGRSLNDLLALEVAGGIVSDLLAPVR